MKCLLPVILFFCFTHAFSQYPVILSQRDQAAVIDDLLDDRLTNLLPQLMRREGFDMWVIISREYNEDPIIKTMLPATWMASRRTTMLVIFDKGSNRGLEFLAVARYDVGKIFKRSWNPETNPDQWGQLAKIISERNPKKIGINKSATFGHADGISANDYDKLMGVLSTEFQKRVVTAETLGVSWLETRSEKEMIIYPQICRIAHAIIIQGFSNEVIQPGVTTTEDVMWWYREEIKRLKLDTWFHPTVDVQRNEPDSVTAKRPQPLVILPGDLLHVDFGITYLRLNTDTQELAYVLKAGETEVPAFLQNSFHKGNRLQDILTGNFKAGKTGNEILQLSRQQAIAEGLTPSIYTHPIGYHGHAAGTNFGMWDMQSGVPGTGEYAMHYNTAYSIELNCTVNVTEWKKKIRIALEEDGFFNERGFRYIDGRQTEIFQIPGSLGDLR